MALCVCGDVDVSEVEKICDKTLEKAENITVIRDYEDEDEPRAVHQKCVVCELDVAKPIFAIGIKDTEISSDPNERTKKAYAMEVLNEMLFSQSSKFYNDLYNENLVSQDMSSGAEHTEHYSFNVISSESQNPQEVYNRFASYIEDVKKNGLDKESFELSKRTIYASHIKSFDSVENIGDNFIYNLFDGADLLDTADIISSISFEYVEKLLNQLYSEEAYALSIVNPISEGK